MTAYQVLHRTAKVKSGETVLVHGAAGRVGIAVLELGALAGLRLYGTASARDRAAVERLGAVAIDYRNEDFLARVRELTGEAWTSCSTGSAARCRCAPSARCGRGGQARRVRPLRHARARAQELAGGDRVVRGDRGRLASGASSRPAGGCSPTRSRSSATRLRGDPEQSAESPATRSGSGRTSSALLELLRADKIHPVVAERLPLAEARRAHELLESSAAKGKLVLVP